MNAYVEGECFLKGVVIPSGAKNAVLPIICASLLAKGKVLLRNVPNISDVDNLITILRKINCQIFYKNHNLLINNVNLIYTPLLFEECKKLRASYYLIGVFLTLFGKCEIMLPGGCKIGARPIDLHLQVFSDMGYKWEISNDILSITKKKLINDLKINIAKLSVGASINALFTGLSSNRIEIENCLFEPEGIDVISFLRKIGYKIELNGRKLIYEKSQLIFKFIKHTVVYDRIEAMSYAVLGLLTGDITIKKIDTKYLELPLRILKDSGFNISYTNNEIRAKKSVGNAMKITTDVYPGFPTDLQSIYGTLCINTNGENMIEETIFENRMQIYYDLLKSNVSCLITGNKVTIVNDKEIVKQNYEAFDLRHGMAVLLLALAIRGTSTISNFEYILRGYDGVVKKLLNLGAQIKIE